ncbi:1-acyl-sn-glycerol-3-phosphate acyltransferase [Pedobacter suwonensis]|nr:1-acyl-sn-glycerol-3-phosphate acyltransferase [Pedobacter suwonensis]
MQFSEMYQPRKNNLIFKFFSWYIQFIIKKDFAAFNYNAVEIKSDSSILILANHFSWWDGFFLFYINKKVLKKQFHVLVNAENYTKIGFLKYLGAFAAENKGKDVLETLNYAGELLDNPANLVLVFPQGKLYSNHLNGINFEKGVMQIINASQKKINIIFAATFIDYFAKRKPTVYNYLQRWETEEYVSLQLLKSAYNKHYDQSVVKQNQLIE